MNKHSSFLIGLLFALTLTSIPWVLDFCEGQGRNEPLTPPTACSFDSNYELEFNSDSCYLQIRNWGNSRCNLAFSFDNTSWTAVDGDGVIWLSNTQGLNRPCPIVLKDVLNLPVHAHFHVHLCLYLSPFCMLDAKRCDRCVRVCNVCLRQCKSPGLGLQCQYINTYAHMHMRMSPPPHHLL